MIVVTADGTVRCYYDLQGEFNQFSLGNGAEEYGVKACRFVKMINLLRSEAYNLQILWVWIRRSAFEQSSNICGEI